MILAASSQSRITWAASLFWNILCKVDSSRKLINKKNNNWTLTVTCRQKIWLSKDHSCCHEVNKMKIVLRTLWFSDNLFVDNVLLMIFILVDVGHGFIHVKIIYLLYLRVQNYAYLIKIWKWIDEGNINIEFSIKILFGNADFLSWIRGLKYN